LAIIRRKGGEVRRKRRENEEKLGEIRRRRRENEENSTFSTPISPITLSRFFSILGSLIRSSDDEILNHTPPPHNRSLAPAEEAAIAH